MFTGMTLLADMILAVAPPSHQQYDKVALELRWRDSASAVSSALFTDMHIIVYASYIGIHCILREWVNQMQRGASEYLQPQMPLQHVPIIPANFTDGRLSKNTFDPGMRTNMQISASNLPSLLHSYRKLSIHLQATFLFNHYIEAYKIVIAWDSKLTEIKESLKMSEDIFSTYTMEERKYILSLKKGTLENMQNIIYYESLHQLHM